MPRPLFGTSGRYRSTPNSFHNKELQWSLTHDQGNVALEHTDGGDPTDPDPVAANPDDDCVRFVGVATIDGRFLPGLAATIVHLKSGNERVYALLPGSRGIRQGDTVSVCGQWIYGPGALIHLGSVIVE